MDSSYGVKEIEVTQLLIVQVQCAVQLAEQGCMERPHALQGLAGSMHLVEKALGPDHPLVAHILLHQACLLRQHQQHHQVSIPICIDLCNIAALKVQTHFVFSIEDAICLGDIESETKLLCS